MYKRKKTDKKASKMNVLPAVNCRVMRHTYDVWRNCYPESNYDEWRKTTFPDDLIGFVLNILDNRTEDFNGCDKTKYMVVTVADEYMKWLEENHLEHTLENQNRYVSGISEEKALHLLKKEQMQYSYKLVCLSAVVVLEDENKTTFKIARDTCERLMDYFKSIYKHVDIFVPGFVLKPEAVVENVDRLISLTKGYFNDNQWIKLGILEEQNYQKGVNLTSLYIPVIMREEISTPVFSVDTVLGSAENPNLDRCPDLLILDKEGFKEWNINDVEEFEKTEIYREIVQAIHKDNTVLTPNLVDVSEITEMEKQFVKSFKKYGAKIIRG